MGVYQRIERSFYTEEHAVEKLLTLREVEQLTGRKVTTWRKAIYRREIPFVKLGKSIRLKQSDIEAMIARGYCPAVATK